MYPSNPTTPWEPVLVPPLRKKRGAIGYAQHYNWIVRPCCVLMRGKKGGVLFNCFCRDLGFLPGAVLRLFIDRNNQRIAFELLPPDIGDRIIKFEGFRIHSRTARKQPKDTDPVFVNCLPVSKAFPKFIGVVTPLIAVPNPQAPNRPLLVATYSDADYQLRRSPSPPKPKTGDPHAQHPEETPQALSP